MSFGQSKKNEELKLAEQTGFASILYICSLVDTQDCTKRNPPPSHKKTDLDLLLVRLGSLVIFHLSCRLEVLLANGTSEHHDLW